MNSDRKKKRRNEILGAAFEVFAENGYYATRISDIAQRLKMGHGTFYRYFKNKLDIFSAVVDQVLTELINALSDEPPTLTNDLEDYRCQIRRIGEKMFSVFYKDKRIAKILFYEIIGVHPEINDKFEQVYDYFDAYTEQYFINGVEKGFLRPDMDTRMIAHAVNALIFASARDMVIADDPEEMVRRWIDTVVLLMLDGMAKRTEPATGPAGPIGK
ncbi:MAG: TetR/AcrR family transcriptional regulator [Thermodesulfobacteriota bacterium]|nr:TetR/AcrR family transcriptional regulator [Thermodesulfobacteriota bacterium]